MSSLPAPTVEAQQALQRLHTLSHIEPVLEAALSHIAGSTPDLDSMHALCDATGLDATAVGTLYTGMHWLLRECVRSGLKPKALAVELEDLRVPDGFIQPVVAATQRGRSLLNSSSPSGGLPTLEELCWRLDVPISTEALPKVLLPHVTLQLRLSDGTTANIHASKQQFDELRFTVAKLLGEMQALHTRLASVAT